MYRLSVDRVPVMSGYVCMQLDAKGGVLNDSLFRTYSCADYIARSSKVVTLVDLAGHERYFKTTAYGLTGHLPDYACLIVGANAGEPASAVHGHPGVCIVQSILIATRMPHTFPA